MSIKFILDNNLRTNDLEELNKITESLKRKPIKHDHKSIFLRNFTLSIINNFKQSYHPEIKNLEIEPIVSKVNPNQLNVPKKIDFPLELFLEAPDKFAIPRELLKETPSKDLVVNAPSKELFEEAPEN